MSWSNPDALTALSTLIPDQSHLDSGPRTTTYTPIATSPRCRLSTPQQHQRISCSAVSNSLPDLLLPTTRRARSTIRSTITSRVAPSPLTVMNQSDGSVSLRSRTNVDRCHPAVSNNCPIHPARTNRLPGCLNPLGNQFASPATRTVTDASPAVARGPPRGHTSGDDRLAATTSLVQAVPAADSRTERQIGRAHV